MAGCQYIDRGDCALDPEKSMQWRFVGLMRRFCARFLCIWQLKVRYCVKKAELQQDHLQYLVGSQFQLHLSQEAKTVSDAKPFEASPAIFVDLVTRWMTFEEIL